MRVLQSIFAALLNVLVAAALVGLLAGAAWGLWTIAPEESRAAIRDPLGAVESAQRTARYGPTHPLRGLGDAVAEWFAARRDTADVVYAAEGQSAAVQPLPAWTSIDNQRVFGATETLWQSRRAKLAGIRWSRVVFFWSDVQPNSRRDWRAPFYLHDSYIRRERNNGVELVGLLMSTPEWAAANPAAGVHSVPRGLDRPLDDPENVWAVFVRRMAREYRGRIDTWIVWNEPDIQADGPNAQYYSWAGTHDEYALLLKTAYLAAKQGNPNARVLFGATTYWADESRGQPLFLERTLDVLARDPEAGARGYYFDAVALNLYTSPDDLARVAGVYRDVLARRGLNAPLWLTETNAVPFDDAAKGLAREQDGLRVTLEQQASFVVQAYALGMASGYERIAIHATTDRDTEDELWGLIRNDGSLRPAFVAYQTAARYFGGAVRATFAGRERPDWRWARGGYVPNWQVYLVALERPSGAPTPLPTPLPTAQPSPAPAGDGAAAGGLVQRVTVVWNGDGVTRRVLVPRLSERAALVDKYGRAVPLEAAGDSWVLSLPAASAHSTHDPEGYFYVGGDPLLLVEEHVAPGAPVLPPSPVE